MPRRLLPFASALALALLVAGAAAETGLPLPRFVSLRADEVNMRAGPGVEYPVEWVYGRRALPVEVIAEYQAWRKVRDWRGTEGWIHRSMLDGARTLVVTGGVQSLLGEADAGAPALARVEPGVVGRLLECPRGSAWCRVGLGRHEGWLRREGLWGVHAGEVVD